MKFIEISINNFMPYKGLQKVVFPTDSHRNVMILHGDNMRGKTSFLNAIRWCLYGKAYTRHKSNIELHNLFNIEAAQEGANNFSISLTFEAGGNRYELTRLVEKKPYISKPSRNDDFEVQVFLRKNGETLSGNQIESEINLYAPEQVSRFFLFDGELLQEYEMLLDESNSKGQEIKDSIEQVLGVPALINGRIESQTLQRESERNQTKEIAKIDNLRRMAENQANFQREEEVKLEDLARLKALLRETSSEKISLDNEVANLSKYSDIATEMRFKKLEQETHQAKLTQIEEEVLKMSSEAYKDLLKPKLISLEKFLIDEIGVIANEFSRAGALNNEIETLQSLLKLSICPTCTQEVDSVHKDKFLSQLADLENKVRTISKDQDKLSQYTSQLNAIRLLITSTIGDRLKEKYSEITNIQVQLTRLTNQINKLYEDLQGQNEDELIAKKRRLEQLIRDEQKINDDIVKLEADIAKIRNQIDAIGRQIANANPDTKNSRAALLASYFKQLESAFRSSVDTLRDRLKQEVEKKASDAFLELTTQKKYSGLKINSSYGLTILDKEGNEVPLRSSGAEQIVALSLIDGLGRTGRAYGPVVMDTPFGRLSLSHRRNILDYFPKHASQLILLVHDGEINRLREDLQAISERLGKEYQITEINEYNSRIEQI
ncbi:AAA family ATPase [Polynucleobacter paneuropaeus]|nr:AAA family ATPase [Polynucleobacter paneuropaeus]